MFCNFVNQDVDPSRLSRFCPKEGDPCTLCNESPQLALGMPVDRLLDQLKEGD
jgi:hypothetical protein